ncbi:histidine phosphatase family protein [Thauera linaloolentis]|uniref:Phosphoglycerate mutase n=1 Tax=Thauera linaloolentis (strain DSM 12138 / JCM 21573 / CCUG 41526 / CIP 105981 / IAM 15112 / NBRC 102519 / 47Lol) TaxID=1123367 RepID=N6Y165_THAL4|nr:histidine phosphatase family protein [Thauera linaloolentis]ENO85285.1 phosphoglycerate mutase [Thauera linaloolentis 47Lol = DSM 12138]MCM8563992.1 histidine phosphatase family protein [Thauera linaloolentis]
MQNLSNSCRICLIRHGETAWNAERRLQGHLDIPLNETGLAQAEAVARRLQAFGQGFAALYCSDLQRARQTAAAITHRHALEAIQDGRLRERHYGLFQGLTYGEAEQCHPELYRRFKAREPEFGFPEHGESLGAFSARVHAALHDIADHHAGQAVLVVTHGGVLDIVHRLASGEPLSTPRDFPIPNAALNWVEHTNGAWRLLAWADEGHLGGALDELPNA